MVGDHAPTIGVSCEHVGGEGTEIGGCALHYAGDTFDTGDESEFALDYHVQVPYLKLHQGGVLEDSLPTQAN